MVLRDAVMLSKRKLLVAKISLVFSALPVLMYAYEFGPPAFRTGAPGEATCLGSGCHSGTLNSAAGNVKIVLPGTSTYTPGLKQRIMVQITDSTRQKFGFEMTARLASNIPVSQAGDFNSTDALTQVICADESNKTAAGCGARVPIQFIQHTSGGFTASTSGGYTYQFDWTPPATNVGNVNLYVAANAGPGGAPSQSNANVYTSTVTLTPAVAVNTPAITPGGVVPVYSSSTTVQPGSWFSVYGNNLAADFKEWQGDFPTSLGGTTVTINGKAAYLWFVSPGQINAQAPDDTMTGSVNVVVTTAAGSNTTALTLGTAGPSFLLLGDAKHATGVIISLDNKGSQAGGAYDLLGPASTGAGFRAAKKGENVAVYAVGFGPTVAPVPAGKVFAGVTNMVTKPQVTLGGVPLTLDFAGVIGAGLYQLNFKIPDNVGTGDLAFRATVNGLQSQANVFIPVQ